MKPRAWGNAYCVFWAFFNDIVGKAEIHFQGHLSCWDVSESVTLWPCHGWGWEWTLGHRHVKSPQPLLNWSTKTERGVSRPLVILHLFVVVLHHFFVLCLIIVTSVSDFLKVSHTLRSRSTDPGPHWQSSTQILYKILQHCLKCGF